MPASTLLEFSHKRNGKATAHQCWPLCLLWSYDWDLVLMVNTALLPIVFSVGTNRLGSSGRCSLCDALSSKKLLSLYTVWAVSDRSDEQQGETALRILGMPDFRKVNNFTTSRSASAQVCGSGVPLGLDSCFVVTGELWFSQASANGLNLLS